MKIAELAKTAFAIPLAGGLLSFGNENYEMLKTDFGLMAPIACLICGCGLLYFGIKSFRRALAS